MDTGLRPEGRNGPLVRTLASYEAYYTQWAQPWRFRRCCAHRVAGDLELGERFLLMADRTRYPAGGVSAEAVQEIRRIKARVDAERLPAARIRTPTPSWPRRPGRHRMDRAADAAAVRAQGACPALHVDAGGAQRDRGRRAHRRGDIDLLRQAWLTATRARNALVLVRGKPTDQLPGPGRMLNAVAVAAGWDNDDGGEFLDNYLRVTRRAKTVVRKVFGG